MWLLAVWIYKVGNNIAGSIDNVSSFYGKHHSYIFYKKCVKLLLYFVGEYRLRGKHPSIIDTLYKNVILNVDLVSPVWVVYILESLELYHHVRSQEAGMAYNYIDVIYAGVCRQFYGTSLFVFVSHHDIGFLLIIWVGVSL